MGKTIKPVADPPRPVPFHLKTRVDKEIAKVERADTISNIILAPKDDGSLRAMVDMRQVNKAIKKAYVPIPNVEEKKAQ